MLLLPVEQSEFKYNKNEEKQAKIKIESEMRLFMFTNRQVHVDQVSWQINMCASETATTKRPKRDGKFGIAKKYLN